MFVSRFFSKENPMTRLLCVLAILGLATIAQAGEQAATAQLPAALQAVGATNGDVMTEKEAHDVRAQWWWGPSLTQYKSFATPQSA